MDPEELDEKELATQKFTLALMIVTAFIGLLAAVGYLSLEFGNDLARTAGIVLMFIPLLLFAGGGLYLLWRLNPVRALGTLIEGVDQRTARWSEKAINRKSDKAERQGSGKTINRRSDKAEQQRQRAAVAVDDEEDVRSTALPIYRSTALDRSGASEPARVWVRLGTSRHQRLTPEEMAVELERLVPLAAQAEEAERRATRMQEALHRLEAQSAAHSEQLQASLTQQAEALAAQWTAEVIARWYGVLFGEREMPAPDKAFEGVRVELERLREVAAQAGQQRSQLAETAQALQRHTDDLASAQQQLNTARQRLEAVREALGIPTDVSLVEGARARQAELRVLTSQLSGVDALRAARDAWQQKAEALEETMISLQAESTRLRTAVQKAAKWEEVAEEELANFWPTVQLDGEAYLASQRRQRRLLQRLRAENILLIRHRTTVLAASGGGAPYSPVVAPPLPHHEDSPTALSTEKADAENPASAPGEGGATSTVPGTVASTVDRVRRVRQRVRPVRYGENSVRSDEKPVRSDGRRRRSSMGHY